MSKIPDVVDNLLTMISNLQKQVDILAAWRKDTNERLSKLELRTIEDSLPPDDRPLRLNERQTPR